MKKENEMAAEAQYELEDEIVNDLVETSREEKKKSKRNKNGTSEDIYGIVDDDIEAGS